MNNLFFALRALGEAPPPPLAARRALRVYLLRSALLFVLLLVPQQAFALAKVQEVISPGGVKAWLIEEHSLPLISLRAVFTHAGSASDPAGREGRASMVSDLLPEGAGERNALAFSTALEERAIRMSFVYDEDLMSATVETLSEHKISALGLFAEALTHPRFDDDAIARVRAQALTGLKQLQQSPGWLVGRAWNEAAFGAHPYGQQGAGTEVNLKLLAKKDFTLYRERYLTRENLIIGVVGDITAEQLKPLLDSTFAGLPAKFRPERETSEVKLPAKGKTVRVEKDIPQSIVMFGSDGFKRTDPAYFDGMVLNYIIGGDLNSRLATEVREKRGLAYSINTYPGPMLNGATWSGSFSTRTEQVEEALKTAIATIDAAHKDGVTLEEVERAKRYLTGSFMLSLDTNRELAGFLISMQMNRLGMDYLEKRNTLVNAVTMESVRAAGARLLDSNRFIIAIIGKETTAGKPHAGN